MALHWRVFELVSALSAEVRESSFRLEAIESVQPSVQHLEVGTTLMPKVPYSQVRTTGRSCYCYCCCSSPVAPRSTLRSARCSHLTTRYLKYDSTDLPEQLPLCVCVFLASYHPTYIDIDFLSCILSYLSIFSNIVSSSSSSSHVFFVL